MNRTDILKNILIYLLSPEDTTDSAGDKVPCNWLLLQAKWPWLGRVKGVFWTIAAIFCPLILCMMLSWNA